MGTGGAVASGGRVGTGGAIASSGGAVGAGGAVVSGGAPGTGGAVGSGGAVSTGGAATGGASGSVPPGTIWTFQAEMAYDLEEGVVETIHAGYTGTGYVNIENFPLTFAWYIVSAPVAGRVAVVVRYANGGTADRPIGIKAGGRGAGALKGASTGAWTNWTEEGGLFLDLNAGDNDVFFTSVSSDGMPNIDKFDLIW